MAVPEGIRYRHFLFPRLSCAHVSNFVSSQAFSLQPYPTVLKWDTNKRKAVGLLFPKKGGLAYAYLCYVSSVRDYRADQTDEKKQQPPLGQVTVVRKTLTIII